MSRWKTATIAALVTSIPGITVIDTGLSEDYVTEQLTVSVEGTEKSLYVRGFVTDGKPLPGEDDVDVEMVEVTTGYSDGDMPNDPVLVVKHAEIKAALMTAGHKPVNSMEPYF